MPPLTLWLTDRSRYTTGTGLCETARYHRYHAGPTGYGWVKKRESLPLMTGGFTHTALEVLFLHLQQYDALPPRTVIHQAIDQATKAYGRKVEARGFRGLLQSETSDLVLLEQQYLLTGLVHAFAQTVLPWIHTTYRIIRAEQERLYVLDCTCGLTSAVIDANAHDARGCHGVAQQLRLDCLAQHRQSQHLANFESKTTGWAMENWAPRWETRPQLSISSFGVKEEYGQEITENYIIGLYKGARRKVKSADPFESDTVRQDSPFCYGYFRPGNPPMATDEWKPAYEWVDAYGVTQYARKPFVKHPVWLLRESDWPTYLRLKQEHPDLSDSEIWVHTLPKSVIEKQVFLVGPLNRQDVQIANLKRQIVGEERRWQGIMWELYEKQVALREQGVENPWAHPEFQALLTDLVPASWECRKFGAGHECEYKPLCFKESGWEDPMGTGEYIARRPHHAAELEQAVARGLLPEQSAEEEEDDE